MKLLIIDTPITIFLIQEINQDDDLYRQRLPLGLHISPYISSQLGNIY